MTSNYRSLVILILSSGFLFGCSHISMGREGLNHMVQREPKTLYYETSGYSVQIKYYQFGSGEPVILLHGFASSSYTWLHIAEALSKDHTVVALDLKGFGLSDKPADARYSPLDQADIVRRLILEQDMKDITIVGHSFGGAVVLSTYNSLSDERWRIKAMVLVDTFIQNPVLPLRMKIVTAPLVSGLALRLLPANLCASIILRGSYLDSSKITDETFRTYAHYIGLPGASHAMAETVRKFFYKNSDDLLKVSEVDIPVLLIWGDRDPVFPLSNGEILTKKMRKAKLVVVPECGHVPQEEKPVETIQILTEFLKLQN